MEEVEIADESFIQDNENEALSKLRMKRSKNQKYSLKEKIEVAKIAIRFRNEYQEEERRLKSHGKIYQKGKWVQPLPKVRYLVRTI